jgi:hypothetical protein
MFPRVLESLLLLLLTASFLVSCNTDGGDPLWLDSLPNPFLGEWEADIPSAQMHLVFTYKNDGTFDFSMEGMTGSGAYVIKDDIIELFNNFSY